MITTAEDPTTLPGWDVLSAGETFYSGSHWLAFSDSDGLARPHYLVASEKDGSPTAALSAHWSPWENNEDYVASQVLSDVDPAPALILGGRRGYLSAVLAAPGADDDLAALVTTAVDAVPEAAGRWWWPYLPADQAHRLGDALGHRGRPHLVGADCAIAVPPGGLDEHVNSLLTRQRRTNVRRDLRRYREAGLRTVCVPLGESLDTLGPMLSNVQRKYGHDHSPEQMTGLLRRQAAHLADAAVVFLCLAADDEAPLGFCLAYRHGSELSVRVVGFDYPRLRAAAEYPNLAIHEPLRYCHENNLTSLHLGMESFDAKCRRGAAPRALWALSSFATPTDTTERARTLAAALPAHESQTFLTEVAFWSPV